MAHSRGIRAERGDHAARQRLREQVQPLEHARACEVEIDVVLEDDIDHREAEGRRGAHHTDAGQPLEAHHQRIGDLVLHLLQRPPRPIGEDDDLAVGQSGNCADEHEECDLVINWLIELSLRNRFLVIAFFVLVGAWGYWALVTTPIDAIPDLSDNQVIIFTDWTGRSPQEVEDQITYPLTVSLQGLPGVRVVRSSSAFGFSMINVIFEDDVDLYFARSRVLERVNLLTKSLPGGVVPTLGPDATGVGHV